MPDEFERLDNMMRDDGKPKPPPSYPPKADEEQSASPYAGVALSPMPVASVENLPAQNPIKWKQFEERYHFLPYDSPTTEFIQNRFKLNQQSLLYRWEGMDKEAEIFMIFCSDDIELDRIHAQNIKRRNMALPDPKDPLDVDAENRYQAQIIKNRIDWINYALEQNVEVTVEQYFQIKAGTTYKEQLRPLSSQSRARLDRDLIRFMEQYRIVSGQASKTINHNHDVGPNTVTLLDEAMKRNAYKTPGGYSMEELEKMSRGEYAPPLPESDIVEGETENNEYNP